MHDTWDRPTPTCPGCGYALDYADMQSDFADADLFAIAPREERASVTCPQCNITYWVQGRYTPTYTSAFAEEDL